MAGELVPPPNHRDELRVKAESASHCDQSNHGCGIQDGQLGPSPAWLTEKAHLPSQVAKWKGMILELAGVINSSRICFAGHGGRMQRETEIIR